MAKNLFSVPIFFIVFRETLEAAIILSVLLGIVDQLVYKTVAAATPSETSKSENDASITPSSPGAEKRVARRLRLQIAAGAGLGFFVALVIGAAFIAVWFTQANDFFAKAEEVWEGVFNLIASIIIFVVGIGMLRLDRSKVKWRGRLLRSLEGKATDRSTRSARLAFFILPFITVLREGLEAVVFVGGVSLGQPATSIPIAAIVGIICGVIAGYLIYAFASRTTLTIFLVIVTNFLLLIGAGLFSKAVGNFERDAFNKLTGGDAAEAGDGPGSFELRGYIWHLNCCSPENKFDNNGWSVFAGIFGWSNNGSLGTVLSYIFYWVAVMGTVIYLKFKEGRTGGTTKTPKSHSAVPSDVGASVRTSE